MKNTIFDLNNYLFEEMERLNDDSITDEQLERELKKSEGIIRISEKIIQNAELAYKAMKYMDEYGYNTKDRSVPAMLVDKS